MNLVNELKKTANDNATRVMAESRKMLNQVKNNLDLDERSDREMLGYFGTSEIAEEHRGKIRTATTLLEGEYLTTEDIKKVCNRYRLKFLGSRNYKNEIPLRVLNDLKNFKKEREKFSPMNLYVIAPGSHFTLTERPKTDPVLLYGENDRYTVVSTWGNDFSWKRRAWVMIDPFLIPVYVLTGFAMFIHMILPTDQLPKWAPMPHVWFELPSLIGLFVAFCCACGRLDWKYNDSFK